MSKEYRMRIIPKIPKITNKKINPKNDKPLLIENTNAVSKDKMDVELELELEYTAHVGL